MEEFPARIVVGEGPYQTVYVLQTDQLLIRFHKETEESTIDGLLKKRGLREHRVETGVRRQESLRAARMRWVHMRQTERLRDLAVDLVNGIQAIIDATPIYFVDGGGEDTAASPMAHVLVVRLKDPKDTKTLRELVAMGLEQNEQMSSLLGSFLYFEVKASADEEGEQRNGFDLIGRVSEMPGVDNVEFDWLKLETYQQFIPNDTLWPNQWNMAQINLVNAWDVETGTGTVWIAIIDSGFDLAHADITYTPNAGGTLTHFNADEAIAGNPPPYNAGPSGVPHGTAVTGLAAAIINNAQGVAGVAGGCSVMPVRLGTVPTADRVAAGINWAAANGARVGNLSLTTTATAAATAAVANAWTAGMVLCAATGNGGGNTTSPAIGFPANHANTIAVGASDQSDQRKRPASADAECWGSQFGPQIDVVAPGVLCWTTDEQGANGYNNNNGGPITGACVNYANSGDTAGNYFAVFNGTSAATPHVAGLAGLLFSQYTTLTNQQVRDIIERTCAKVNTAMYPYAHDATRPNGTWHQEMGYGRINCNAALRYTDVMIADHDLDTGAVPSTVLLGGTWTPAAFWTHQPYVTTTDQPAALPVDHEPAVAGQDNYVHALVVNLGPADAANVQVTWHIMNYPGTELLWPADWNLGNQIAAATIPNLPAGTSAPVQANWPEALVNVASAYAHPCMVVQAISGEDIGGDLGDYVYEYNNIAQHNISFAGFSSPATEEARTFTLPFAIGHVLAPARRTRLLFNLSRANGATVILDTNPDPELPYIDRILEVGGKHPPKAKGACGGRILSDARIVVDCGGCSMEVVLKAGSTFRLGRAVTGGPPVLDELTFINAAPVARAGKIAVLLEEPQATVGLLLAEGQVLPMALTLIAPASARSGDRFAVDVTQISDGAPTGGLTLEVTGQ